MLEQLNKVFKNIFSNEETIIFSLAIVLFFIVLSLFGSIQTTLTPKSTNCLEDNPNPAPTTNAFVKPEA